MGLFNTTCNATLDDLRIGSSEADLVGGLTFHSLGIIICAGCTLIAVLLSFFLILMHATHYTKPYEQRHIIRILFMIPVYAASSLLSFYYYWHAVYFSVISGCYEAFALASFFALLCHYIAPDLHDQKIYFRGITAKPWVWPMNWFKKCCGGERGLWRTPRSGLTWFNIVWTGVYQYCFLRVAMTVTAVVTQYFGRYCDSSNSPVFAHIWVLVIESVAVTIAMYCLIQFYIQLRVDLASHRPFLKVAAIKLVIFLSFWQSFLISILTSSTLNLVTTTKYIGYPDLVIGIPSLLLCIEMALFSILHLFAFPYTPYLAKNALVGEPKAYPLSPASDNPDPVLNELGPNQGGFLGIKAFVDAMNPWDLVKGFARGMRWLFVGVKTRENDPSYKNHDTYNLATSGSQNDMSLGPDGMAKPGSQGHRHKNTADLPIAMEFRRSKFGMPTNGTLKEEEEAQLLTNAQNHGSAYVPARQRYDSNGQDISSGGTPYDSPYSESPDRLGGRNGGEQGAQIGMAVSGSPPRQGRGQGPQAQAYLEQKRLARQQRQDPPTEEPIQQRRPSEPEHEDVPPNPQLQAHIHNELWGAGQHPGSLRPGTRE